MTEFRANLPLSCINIAQPELSGRPCDGCPMLEIGCTALAAGVKIEEQQRTITNLEAANQVHEERNAKLLDRLFNLRMDALVKSALTPEGFKDILENSPELIEELRGMQWGVVRLDGRFVNYINKFGNEVGDEFLEQGGNEITAISDGLVRRGERRSLTTDATDERRKNDRRVGKTVGGDFICRQGGDEFSLLIRGVDATGLARVSARIQSRLTPSYALERYESGQLPFIASVGISHASQNRPKAIAALANDKPWEAFLAVNSSADEGQRNMKSQQYEEMWQMVLSATPPEARELRISQPDDRIVAQKFLQVLCPDFHEDPITFLRQAGSPSE